MIALRRYVAAIVVIFLLIASMPSYAEIDAPFDKLQWKGRALIITGPFDHEFLEPQLKMLEAALPGIIERDLIVIRFYNEHVQTIEELSAFPFQVPDMYWDGKKQQKHRNYLQRLLQTDDDVFSLVLVGKDGGVKKVWKDLDRSVPPQEIFGLIDAMPMRAQEMKK